VVDVGPSVSRPYESMERFSTSPRRKSASVDTCQNVGSAAEAAPAEQTTSAAMIER
jgi:hypothetical protein